MTKLEALQSDYELQIARLKDDRNELKAELAALRAERDRFLGGLRRIADGEDGTGARVHGSGYPDNVQQLARDTLEGEV